MGKGGSGGKGGGEAVKEVVEVKAVVEARVAVAGRAQPVTHQAVVGRIILRQNSICKTLFGTTTRRGKGNGLI